MCETFKERSCTLDGIHKTKRKQSIEIFTIVRAGYIRLAKDILYEELEIFYVNYLVRMKKAKEILNAVKIRKLQNPEKYE